MQEKFQKKLMLPLIALALVGVGGSVYALNQAGPIPVSAQTSSQSATARQKPQTDATAAQDTALDKQEPSYTSSVKSPVEGATEVNDTKEAQQLASLAKISEAQAKDAAQKSVGGTATSVKLENENGGVVYSVTVGTKEVKVDAGNGSVLLSEAADSGEKSGKSDTGGTETPGQ